MLLRKLIMMFIFFIPIVCVRAADKSYDQFGAYLLPWNSMIMNDESPATIREAAVVIMHSSDKLYINGLASILKLNSIKGSKIRVNGQFTLHLVLDFYIGKKRVTYLSDGKQLCTQDLNHCIDVDKKFKHRFDPAYLG